MKDITSVESLVIPEGVTIASKARTITVEGPRGKLVKRVGHIQMDIQVVSWGRVDWCRAMYKGILGADIWRRRKWERRRESL